MKSLLAGIDAGGTTVRVQYADADTLAPVGPLLQIPAFSDGEPPTDLPAPPGTVVAVCAGITKITRAGVQSSWERFLRRTFADAHHLIVPDYVIAFHATHPDAHGVVIIAGTGSVAYGENQQSQKQIRVGGRGWEWGDEGSGAWLTAEMVRRTLRALDGQAEETGLTRAICTELGTTNPALLAGEARRRALDETGNGRGFLVPLLHRLADEKDPDAIGLFVGAGGWLFSLAYATAHRLGFAAQEPVTFTYAGGVWDAGGETIRTAFTSALGRRYPNAVLSREVCAPVLGAVRLANIARGKRSESTKG